MSTDHNGIYSGEIHIRPSSILCRTLYEQTDLVRGKQQIPETNALLVVRSGEIDSQLESTPETILGLIHNTL